MSRIWDLLDDHAPRVHDVLARLYVAVDTRLVHAAWLRGFMVRP